MPILTPRRTPTPAPNGRRGSLHCCFWGDGSSDVMLDCTSPWHRPVIVNGTPTWAQANSRWRFLEECTASSSSGHCLESVSPSGACLPIDPLCCSMRLRQSTPQPLLPASECGMGCVVRGRPASVLGRSQGPHCWSLSSTTPTVLGGPWGHCRWPHAHQPLGGGHQYTEFG